MKECPKCRVCFADDVAFCPDDGAATGPSIAGEPILDGRYNLERRLGQGGMGIVYKGRHIFLKTQHAIKIILPDLVGNDPNLVTRFRQEALAAAAIRHQNIIAVTDFGVVRGTMPFLVMEFVQGKSLQEVMSAEGAMGPVRAFDFMQPICSGIAAAHRQNIVHRDIKPLNVMLQDGLTIAEGTKILDFGLAKIKSGELLGSFVAAQTTGLMGSPFYMAPEQWSDEPPDARADVYSLGVMLYQMLAGEVPFKANAIPAIMKKHLTEEPPTFSSRGIEVPPQIEAVVRHALEKEPEHRTSSADEFLEEFRQAMEAASALLKTTGEARQPDPYQTLVTGPPPATDPHVGRSSYTRPTEDLIAAAISSKSWMEEQDKLTAAREELAREEQGRRQLAAEAERKRREDEARQEAERQQQLKQKQEEERIEAERLAAEQRAAEEREREAERVRDEEARKLREAEEARRQEEQRLEEARRKEQQRLDEERRREEERKRVEELVAQQTKAIEEKLTKLASSIPPAPAAVAEAANARQVGATTITENSYPNMVNVPPAAVAGKRNVLPYALAGVLLLVLVGGGIGAWVLWPRPTPTPGGGDNPPIENPKDPDPGPAPVTFTPEFISVPGGTFDMGRNGATVAEVPVHAASVQPLVIDKTEVTNYEYQQFVEKTGHEAPSHWINKKPIAGQELWPVTFVSHSDAVAFAKWRSERDGLKWRLPTEEEWEYAARGGDQENIYPWGNTWTEGHAITKSSGANEPKPVGSAPNDKTRWGALDMMGNVYEWTATKARYYQGSSKQVEGEQRNWYVIRGASFGTAQEPKPISTTRRDWVDGNTKVGALGFRLVRPQ
ncbi:MAG TPA: bifunctional serine/threonine-protein kinase/formylglycine-generating enzyme family protein [Pyrinomonadaceae bacterium]|nr:bifunctional serine/threonine-protein kinase/formylglycine-generating enzyme family protein [Pyrinomonadaceae bacterium]